MLRPFCSFLQNIGPKQTESVKKKMILYHKNFDKHIHKGFHVSINPWLQKRVTKKEKKIKSEYRNKLELNRCIKISDAMISI